MVNATNNDLDKTDKRILNEYMADSKQTLRQLAKKLSVSYVTVMNRIKKFEEQGIIRGYGARVDAEKLGYQLNVMIHVRISKGKLRELERKIASNPHVYAVYDITGTFDCTILARFRTTQTMDTFIKKLQTYEFVERTNTQIILNTIKEGQVSVR